MITVTIVDAVIGFYASVGGAPEAYGSRLVCLHLKVEGDPSEISRTSASKHNSLRQGKPCCIIDDDVYWHTPRLCTAYCITNFSVYMSIPTVLLEYTNLQLGCIDCYCYLHACE